jgi:hypothetical protein
METELWSIAKSIIGALVAVAAAIGGWLWHLAVQAIRSMEEKLNSNILELKDFKLQVAENHPTKSDLSSCEMTLRDAISRMHDRIDIVSEDIKTLLRIAGNGNK